MFLTKNDYIVISTDAINILQQSTEEKRITAERMAREEMAGYLRSRFDTDAIFAAEGDERNNAIVMYACDITLYHLVSWLPNKMGREIRKERYERAIKWLEAVQAGKISPELATRIGDDGQEVCPIKFGSNKKQDYNW